MNPTRDSHATLVDLLDRALEKGLMIDADLIIHVAGIPLLGLKLRAALAGMETMLKYGIWKDWDEAQRAVVTEEQRQRKSVALIPGEVILLKTFASEWHGKGVYHSWRLGQLFITDRRLFLLRDEPTEILFQFSFEEIKGVATAKKTNPWGKEINYLYLMLKSGEVTQLHSSDTRAVKDIIENRMKTLGLKTEENIPISPVKYMKAKFLSNKEQLIHSGKIFHLVTESRPGYTASDVWKQGHLYLTSERLVCWLDFDAKVAFEVPLNWISAAEVKRRGVGGLLKNRMVLDITYENGAGSEIASFCATAEELNEWQKIIREVKTGHLVRDPDSKGETEACTGYDSTMSPPTDCLSETT
jgi:hypothetical protein